MAKGRNAEAVGVAILATFETPNFFSGLLPSRMTIARFAAEPRDRVQLRKAEGKAFFYSVALGAGASLLTDSILPLMGTTVMSMFLVLTDYEPAIRDAMNNPDATPIDQQPSNGQTGTIGAAIARFTPKRWSFATDRGSFINSRASG